MAFLLIIGALVGGWAVLAVLSGERERRMAQPDPLPTSEKLPEPPPSSTRPRRDAAV